MFQFIIGFILGANIGLFLYALILSGAKEDGKCENEFFSF